MFYDECNDCMYKKNKKNKRSVLASRAFLSAYFLYVYIEERDLREESHIGMAIKVLSLLRIFHLLIPTIENYSCSD